MGLFARRNLVSVRAAFNEESSVAISKNQYSLIDRDNLVNSGPRRHPGGFRVADQNAATYAPSSSQNQFEPVAAVNNFSGCSDGAVRAIFYGKRRRPAV